MSAIPSTNDRERSLETPLCPINVRQRLMANPNSILAFESRFGPQSSLIDIAAFVRSASNRTPFQVVEADHDIIEECRSVIFSPSNPWPNEDSPGPAQCGRSENFSGGCVE